MKKLILLASLSAFMAAPVVACDMDHAKSAKDDKAAVSTDKTTVKADAKTDKTSKTEKTKTTKVVAATTTKKAKI